MSIKTEHKKQKEEIKKGIKAIWRHTKPFKVELTFLVILGLVSSVANGFVPYITGRFFDALIALAQNEVEVGWGDLPIWVLLLGIWAMVQFIANNIDWVMDRLRRDVSLRAHFNVQFEGFAHFFRLPLSYHKTIHINGELQKISNVGWRLSSALHTITNLAPQFLSILIGIALAMSISPMLASILLTGVSLYVIILVKILLPIATIDSQAHRAWSEGWDDAAAAVMQIESVKQAVAEEYESTRVKASLLGRAYGLWKRLENNWSNIGFFQRMLVFLRNSRYLFCQFE